MGRPADRQHLLGRGEGEGSQPGAFAADQDHRPHYFFTVVAVGAVSGSSAWWSLARCVAVEPGTVVVRRLGEVAASLLRLVMT